MLPQPIMRRSSNEFIAQVICVVNFAIFLEMRAVPMALASTSISPLKETN
jgi:hypothetical protein